MLTKDNLKVRYDLHLNPIFHSYSALDKLDVPLLALKFKNGDLNHVSDNVYRIEEPIMSIQAVCWLNNTTQTQRLRADLSCWLRLT
jgi:hypothetical protein